MEKYIDSNRIILLFDRYTLESRLLYESVRKLAADCLAIVLEDNCFLPKGVLSVYDLFLGNDIDSIEKAERPQYYNEIVIPDKWSINAGVDEGYGIISYQHEEKGRIHYTKPKEYFVKAVEWYDRKGVTRFWDHYNRYGELCARTVCDHEGQRISQSWFTAKGQEVIVENIKTGDIILNERDSAKIFQTKVDMFIYCFKKFGLVKNRIFYNSLSTPFFISNALGGSLKGDILFWQEAVGDNIPGNMQIILNGQAGRTEKIVVQKKSAYNRLVKLGANKEAITELGFIYPFEKENQHKREALICTNTDQIEHCRELVEVFPQMHFHIAAVTEMSANLMELQSYKNVSLYPGAVPEVLDELFKKCDFYFDINHYKEIESALLRAFLHNHLIFAFDETLHNEEYVAEEHIYPVAEFEKMVSEIKAVMESEASLDQHLERQRRHALAENVETYRSVIYSNRQKEEPVVDMNLKGHLLRLLKSP